jgi:hypothetical protein
MIVGNTVQDIFGKLPDEETLLAQSLEKKALRTNAHVHLPPNFGSIESIDHALANAKAEEIAILGTANYYDYSIYTPFAHAAVRAGVTPVFGIEVLTLDSDLQAAGIRVNDPKNAGKVYMCGRGLTNFDAIPESCIPLWQRIREGDKERITEMIARLNGIELLKNKAIQLGYEAIAESIAEEKGVPIDTVFLQERHLVQALQKAIWTEIPGDERIPFLQTLYQTDAAVNVKNVVKVQDELRNALLKQGKVAYVDERFVTPEEAAELILGLGGYVSYPTLIDGAPEILPGEGTPDELAATLFKQQIGAAEFIPIRNDHTVLTTYVTALRDNAIVVGAGTEHNTASWIPLLPACVNGVPLGEELTEIFWEGACVAVAHQYLRAKGQPGFQFLTEKDAREAQIQRMADLGAKVVHALRHAQG